MSTQDNSSKLNRPSYKLNDYVWFNQTLCVIHNISNELGFNNYHLYSVEDGRTFVTSRHRMQPVDVIDLGFADEHDADTNMAESDVVRPRSTRPTSSTCTTKIQPELERCTDDYMDTIDTIDLGSVDLHVQSECPTPSTADPKPKEKTTCKPVRPKCTQPGDEHQKSNLRFKTVSETSIDKLAESKNSEATKRQTKWSIKILKGRHIHV